MTERCQYKIRWTFGTDAQCERDGHVEELTITPFPDGRLFVQCVGDPEHQAKVGPYQTSLTWHAGDRREFTGNWPGPCTGKVPGCVLHTGHHGRCAP